MYMQLTISCILCLFDPSVASSLLYHSDICFIFSCAMTIISAARLNNRTTTSATMTSPFTFSALHPDIFESYTRETGQERPAKLKSPHPSKEQRENNFENVPHYQKLDRKKNKERTCRGQWIWRYV